MLLFIWHDIKLIKISILMGWKWLHTWSTVLIQSWTLTKPKSRLFGTYLCHKFSIKKGNVNTLIATSWHSPRHTHIREPLLTDPLAQIPHRYHRNKRTINEFLITVKAPTDSVCFQQLFMTGQLQLPALHHCSCYTERWSDNVPLSPICHTHTVAM